MKTIVWKELREHARWLPLGMLPIVALLVWRWSGRWVIFGAYGDLPYTVASIAAPIAAGLGLVQCWPDERPAARALLLHRGITPGAAFFGKLIAGLILYGAATVLPLAILALWAAIVGQSRGAVYPSVVLPSLLVVAGCFACWPAAFLLVQRREAWILGSRLLPCLAAGLAVFSVTSASNHSGTAALVLVLGSLGVFLLAAGSVYRRNDGQAVKLGRAALAAAVIVALFAAVFYGVGMVETLRRERNPQAYTAASYGVQFGPDGHSWLTRKQYDWGTYTHRTTAVARMDPAHSVRNELQPAQDWKALAEWSLRNEIHSPLYWKRFGIPFAEIGSFPIAGADPQARRHWILDMRQGELLGIRRDPRIRLEKRLEPVGENGATSKNGDFGELYYPYSSTYGRISNGAGRMMFTSTGVYILSAATLECLREFSSDSPLIGYSVSNDRGSLGTIVLRFSDRIVILEARLPKELQGVALTISSESLGELFSTEIRLPDELAAAERFKIARAGSSPDEFVALVEVDVREGHDFQWYRFGQDGEIRDREVYVENTTAESIPGQTWVAAFVPPGAPALWFALNLASKDARWLDQTIQRGRDQPAETAAVSVLVSLNGILGILLATWGSQRRRLERRIARRWNVIGLLLGPVGSGVLLAVYRRILHEPCSSCRKLTRTDNPECEVCGALLDEFERTGVEIFDAEGSDKALATSATSDVLTRS